MREYAAEVIEDFIRQKVEESHSTGVVLGLSGGIDSAVTSKLCAHALGPEKVLNLFLPSSSTPESDRKDAEDFCERFGMELRTVPINPALDSFKKMLPEMTDKRLQGNAAARCRMIVLFHYAKAMDRVVMGTSNKSELLVGYFTKFGDGGADFCPIGDLYKTEVRELGKKLEIPKAIITKVPSAGLWKKQTDEGELGLSYDDLDAILLGIEMNLPNEVVAERAGLSVAMVEKVWSMHRNSVHKRKMPLIPKIGIRTLGLDWRE